MAIVLVSRTPAFDATGVATTAVAQFVFDEDTGTEFDTQYTRVRVDLDAGNDIVSGGVAATGWTLVNSLSDGGYGTNTRLTVSIIPDADWQPGAFYSQFGGGGVVEFYQLIVETVDRLLTYTETYPWQFTTAGVSAIDIDSTPVPDGELDVAFTHTFTQSGGTEPVAWSVVSGALPPGLTLDTTAGVLAGTPTTTGTFTFRLQVTDADNLVDQEEFYATVTGCVPRAIAETVGVLIQRVRRETGDRITDPQGNTITDPKFTDDDIRRSLNDTFIKIGKALRQNHRGEALQAVDFAYTESSNRRGMTLPAGVNASAIFQVEDVIDSSIKTPRPLAYVDMAELSTYDRNINGIDNLGNFYTLLVEDEDYRIMIRPTPSAGRYIRIWYAVTPLVTCDDAESLPIAAEWRELIGLDAAMRLMRYDGENTTEAKLALDEQWEQFHQYAKRNKGHQRVRIVPRGVY